MKNYEEFKIVAGIVPRAKRGRKTAVCDGSRHEELLLTGGHLMTV